MTHRIKFVLNGVAATLALGLVLNDPASAQSVRPVATSGATKSSPVTARQGQLASTPESEPAESLWSGDGQSRVSRLLDVDPRSPIRPRVPFPKWGAAGRGSIEAQMGGHAVLTDRIFVKFRDELKVRTSMNPGTELWLESSASGGIGGRGLEDEDPVAEARALLAAYGAAVEQAVKIPAARLKAIEQRATETSREVQPDLGGIFLVTVGKAHVRQAAEAFNRLDCVEFAEVEIEARSAQCQPLDQSLQKGPGNVGANVGGCNQGTDANGNPFICSPYPVIAIPQNPGNTTLGFVNCNKPSFWAYYLPFNNAPLPNGNQACPPAGGYQPDLASKPLWDCTPNCNNNTACADTTSTIFTQGGNPMCQYGCADSACAQAVAQYQPNCTDMSSPQGWDATCATLASIICPAQVGSATPYNGLISGSGATIGALALDQLAQRCYQTLPPAGAPAIFDISNNFAYDPCFVARGPANFVTSAGRGVVTYTDIGDGSGLRPWGFTYTAPPAAMPAYGYLSFAAAGAGAFDDTNQPAPGNVTTPCTSGIGATPIGGTVLAANTFDPALASNATFDPVYKGGPQLFSHACTEPSSLPGCSTSKCCVYVCVQDPSCCDVGWDQGCVDLARGNATLCGQAELGMPSGAGDPTPLFTASGSSTAPTNLQLYTVASPLVNSTAQYIATVPTPTPGVPATISSGPVPLSTVTTQAQLTSTYAFVNSQYGGGGFDLAQFESFATQLPNTTTATARGKGITIGVIDYSAYLNHEDLVGQVTLETGTSVFLKPGGANDPDHGTAVLGILVAKANNFGITGIAPEAKARFYPAATTLGAGRISTAIVAAGEDLGVGDVLCIPLQLGTGGGATICSAGTYNTLLGVTASLGITNVCAAGNGGYATLAPATGRNNAVLVSAVWPGAQTPTPVSGTKTFNAAGTVLTNTLTNPGIIAPGNSYCRWKNSNYSAGNPGVSAAVDVSGWGTAICTLGRGTLWNGSNASSDPLQVNKLRSYQQSFGDTSGACAMIAGLIARIQATAIAMLGSAPSGERVRQVLANQLWINNQLQYGSDGLPIQIGSSVPQCNIAPGVPLPGTLSNAFYVVTLGDLIPANLASQINNVGGFPKAVECLQNVVFTQYFPQGGVPYILTVINGLNLASSTFDAALLDQAYFRIGATKKGRGNAGAGFGRPLVYASGGLVTDIQLKAQLPSESPENLFNLYFEAWGKATTGARVVEQGQGTGSINGRALALAYAWDNRAQRWRYLAYAFIDSYVGAEIGDPNDPNRPPTTPDMKADVNTLGYAAENFATPDGNGKAHAYVRVVTFSAGITGAYQMWWDYLVVSTDPVANP